MILLPASLINMIFDLTKGDIADADLLLSRYFNSELRNQALTELGEFYTKIKNTKDGPEKVQMSLERLRMENHLEFLSRESVRIDKRVEAWIKRAPGITAKVVEKLDKDFSNDKFV